MSCVNHGEEGDDGGKREREEKREKGKREKGATGGGGGAGDGVGGGGDRGWVVGVGDGPPEFVAGGEKIAGDGDDLELERLDKMRCIISMVHS